MDIVMFHSGGKLPEFLEYTFWQIRRFNPMVNIYFLTDESLLGDVLFDKYNITMLDKDLFYTDKIKRFNLAYQRKAADFWTIAATRLIYIENFLIDYKLKSVYHFENDVLLYYDLTVLHDRFLLLYRSIAITPGGPDKSMTGFMYITSGYDLQRMTQFFIDMLEKYGVAGIKKKYQIGMVHEMALIKLYELGSGKINNLPIMPFGNYAENFSRFNSIFDPATWGQFVGGTQSEGPGAKPADHYIGTLLRQHPEYAVVWHRDSADRNVPYFKYDDNEVKINNLHIHSKNLSKYVS